MCWLFCGCVCLWGWVFVFFFFCPPPPPPPSPTSHPLASPLPYHHKSLCVPRDHARRLCQGVIYRATLRSGWFGCTGRRKGPTFILMQREGRSIENRTHLLASKVGARLLGARLGAAPVSFFPELLPGEGDDGGESTTPTLRGYPPPPSSLPSFLFPLQVHCASRGRVT